MVFLKNAVEENNNYFGKFSIAKHNTGRYTYVLCFSNMHIVHLLKERGFLKIKIVYDEELNEAWSESQLKERIENVLLLKPMNKIDIIQDFRLLM